jgi:2-oxoglutarate dehydrogenase E2 component (dihydrolipoamide succinyltransferase)
VAGTILQILVPEGATVAVGTPLVVIGQPGEAGMPVAAPAPTLAAPPPPAVVAPAMEAPIAPPPPTPTPVPAPAPAMPAVPAAPAPAAPTPVGDLGLLSPVVRRLAAEHGVDLARVTGTGAGGRITRRDIEAFVAAPEPVPAAVTTPSEPVRSVLGRGIQDLIVDRPADSALFTPAPPPATPVVAPVTAPPAPVPVAAVTPPAPQPVAPARMAGDQVEELSRLRLRIAENMIRAKQTAAHVWTSVEVDFESVEQVRQRHREGFKEREGFSLTYLPFISRAVVDALAAFPVVNSSLDLENKVRVLHGAVNLGLGVDLDEGGLVVMTMRGVDGLRMRGIAREVRRLAEKARSGKMEPDDLAGSTFTITNPGPFGSFMSAPIINVPNVAILSTDTVSKRPVVVTDADGRDAIAIRHIGYLGLTWDHRAFDGSTAVLFLNRIKHNLETWDWEQELT